MSELGELRPSQLIFTFGVGSLVDLPSMSALVMGLDDWDTKHCKEVTEDRLLAALRTTLGDQLHHLYLPPVTFEENARPDPAAASVGVPVAAFPRWLRCPVCDIMGTIEAGIFNLVSDPRRPDRTRYVHTACPKARSPTALPVRFLIACRNGHLSDFPWIEYVHKARPICKPARLTMREYGAAGDASDIIIKCLDCNTERRMGDAFDQDRWRKSCPGHHPHLRLVDAACTEEAKTILLGASNSWFPMVMTALAIPRPTDKLGHLVDEHWAALKDIDSLEVTRYATAVSRMPFFAGYSAKDIWAAIQTKREAGEEKVKTTDLKVAEWDVFCAADTRNNTSDFTIVKTGPPLGFEPLFEETILVERIREVRALMGFTRIESTGDFSDAKASADDRRTPLCRQAPTWIPASEVRGEGLFIRLKESAVVAWENSGPVRELEQQFLTAHRVWRTKRRLTPVAGGFPGIRYVLLHSLAHALMRQIALECGYTAASIRERIYSRYPGPGVSSMSGFLIYTSASDSEGTLGGLVHLGQPISVGRHLRQALESMRICSSDPLCAEHKAAADGRGIHGASCHACLFAPETSCERGNRYLDRNVLVSTFSANETAFFKT